MNHQHHKQQVIIGIGLAVLATLIWSGNFIIARGIIHDMPPITLAFFRWLCATLILFPFAYKKFISEWRHLKPSWLVLSLASLTGVALFNTFVYIGGHYTSAINLALIGTTSSPVMAIILARIFLNEKIGFLKFSGMLLCIAGILFLLAKGNLINLAHLQFSKGDIWVLIAAFCFAVYNTLVKKKPPEISPVNFLFVVFAAGTLMLLPFYLWEMNKAVPVRWNFNLVLVILYLGLGASVICFLIWNIAIGKLGAGRTALFGNLIPVFSTLEAVIILHEPFTWHHIISMILVFAGILLANLKLLR